MKHIDDQPLFREAYNLASNLSTLRGKLIEAHLDYPELDTLIGSTIGNLKEISYRIKVKEQP